MPRNIDDPLAAENAALREENDSLRQECRQLRGENKQLKDFVDEITGLLPPSYDADEAMEAIIIRYLGDMNSLGSIIARLTADYR
jgi:hypothetical protein